MPEDNNQKLSELQNSVRSVYRMEQTGNRYSLGDPYKGITRAANVGSDALNAADNRRGVSQLNSLIDRAAEREYRDYQEYQRGHGVFYNRQPRSRSRFRDAAGIPKTGFMSRPRTEDYLDIFSTGAEDDDGIFRAAYFQFQNRSVVQSIMTRKNFGQRDDQGQERVQIMTQEYDSDSDENNISVSANIFAPNMVTKSLATKILNRDGVVTTIKKHSRSSFHPKIGYVGKGGDNAELFAFFGTQNITPALDKNSTLESLLVLDAKARQNNRPGGHVEEALAKEVIGITDDLLNATRGEGQGRFFSNIAFRTLREQRRTTGNNLGFKESFSLYNNEILKEYENVLDRAAKSDEVGQVYLSINRMDALMRKSKGFNKIKDRLTRLAEQGKLSIVTDRKIYGEVVASGRSGEYGGLDERFLSTLAKNQAIKFSPTPELHHEKGIGIISKDDRVLYAGIQTANWTQKGMPSYKPGTAEEEQASTELMLRVRDWSFGGRYTAEEDTLVREWLESTGRDMVSHYQTFADGYQAMKKSERNADAAKVLKLKQRIEKLNQQIGATVFQVDERYAPGTKDPFGRARGFDEAVGLRVRVNSAYGLGKERALAYKGVQVDLTVNEEGNVILSDLNKVIGQTLLLNKTGKDVSLPGSDERLQGMRNRVMSSQDTTLGLLSTMASELSYQNRFGLTNFRFQEMLKADGAKSRQQLGGVLGNLLSQSVASVANREQKYLTRQLSLEELIIHGDKFDLKTSLYNFAASGKAFDYNTGEAIGDRTVANAREAVLLGELLPDLTKLQADYQRALSSGDVEEANRLLQTRLYGKEGVIGRFATTLNRDSMDQGRGGVFEDIRALTIASDQVESQRYFEAAQTQARQILGIVADPFLSTHDQETSFNQAKAQRVVYSVRDSRVSGQGTTAYDRTARLGVMDPGEFGHSTNLAVNYPGQFQRMLASTAFPDRANISGYGGVSQVKNISQTDMHQGAAKVYDMETLMKGVSGFMMISRSQQVDEMVEIARLQDPTRSKEEIRKEIERVMEDELDARYNYTIKGAEGDIVKQDLPLYLIPYNKPEQITQRFKNVTGSRAAKDVNPAVYEALKQRKVLDVFQAQQQELMSRLWSGRVRPALQEEQWHQVQELMQKVGDPSELAWHLKRLDSEQLYQNKGVVGPSQLKRMALMGGFNTMGDYGYVNEDYNQPVSESRSVRLQVGLSQVEDITQTMNQIQRYLNKGTMIVGGEGPEAGLYIQQDGSYVKAGRFTDSGLVEITDPNFRKQMATGGSAPAIKNLSFRLNFGAYGKQYEGGITVLTDDLFIDPNARDTLISEQEAVTIFERGSGSRTAGGGALHKEPVQVIQKEIFDKIDRVLKQNVRSQRISMSEETGSQKIYGLSSLEHFKGFNFETGMALLSDSQSFDGLKGLTGDEIATSLSLLFMRKKGDDEVRRALSEHFKAKGQTALGRVVARAKGGVGLDQDAKGLDIMMQGLSYLSAGTTIKSSKDSYVDLRDLVVRSLEGDQEASNQLQHRTQELFNIVRQDGEYSMDIDGRRVFRESKTLVRSAGMLAHSMFFANQMFAPIEERISAGTAFDAKVSAQEYKKIKLKERKGTKLSKGERRKIDYMEYLAAQAGVAFTKEERQAMGRGNFKAVERKLSYLESRQTQDVMLETYVDTTPSKTLVSAGQSDEAKFEAHYYLGRSTEHMAKFKGAASNELQQAYKVLTDAVAGGYHRSSIDSEVMQVKMAMSNVEQATNLTFSDYLKQKYGEEVQHQQQQELASLNTGYLRRVAEYGDKGLETIPKAERSLYEDTTYAKYYSEYAARKARFKYTLNSKEINLRQAAGFYSQRRLGVDYEESVQEILNDETAQSRLQLMRDNYMSKQKTTDPYEDYIHGIRKTIRALERQRDAYERAGDTRGVGKMNNQIRNLQKTQQIVLPAMSITGSGEEGLYDVRLQSSKEASPMVGVLLGEDLLKSLSLVYGEHKNEAIIEQRKMIEALAEAQPIMDKIAKGNFQINEQELSVIKRLQDSLGASGKTLVDQITNETMRKAAGEHEGYTGAVGYPTNSFNLGADEMVMGSRFARPTKDVMLDTAMESAINSFLFEDNNEVAERKLKRINQIMRMADPTGEISEAQVNKRIQKLKKVQKVRKQAQQQPQIIKEMILSHLGYESEESQRRAKAQVLKSLLTDFVNTTSEKREISANKIFNVIGKEAHSLNDEDRRKLLTLIQKDLIRSKDHGYATWETSEREFYNKFFKGSLNLQDQPDFDDDELNLLKDILSKEKMGREVRDLGYASVYQEVVGTQDEQSYGNLGKFFRMIRDKEKLKALRRKLNMKLGSTAQRTGSPAGDYAGLQSEKFEGDEFGSRVLTPEQFAQRQQQEGSELLLSKTRSDTALVLPSFGTNIAGLGDYDGDSFQVLMSIAGRKAAEVKEKQFRYDRKRQLRKTFEANMTRVGDNLEKQQQKLEKFGFEGMDKASALAKVEQDEQLAEAELDKAYEDLLKNRLNLEQAQSNYDSGVKNWVKSITSLPDMFFDGMSGAESTVYISQKFDLSGVMDAPMIDKHVRTLSLLESAAPDEGYIRQQLSQGVETGTIAKQLVNNVEQYSAFQKQYGQDKGFAEEEFEDMLKAYQRELTSGSGRSMMQTASDFLGLEGNIQQELEGVLKSFGKAEGTPLNPFEFEAIQTVIGEGGTKLIGSAYNTLIPLLERSMFEESIMTVMRKDELRNAVLQDDATDDGLKQLFQNQDFQKKVDARYQGTLSTLTAFQQLVRDALKAKSGSKLQDALNDSYFQNTIAELQEAEEGYANNKYTLAQVKEKQQAFDEAKDLALGRLTGAKVYTGGEDDMGRASTFFRNQLGQRGINNTLVTPWRYDKEATAFGTLLDIAEFAKTDSSQIAPGGVNAVEERFINRKGLEGEFAEFVTEKGGSANEFVAIKLAEQMMRTEAMYKAGTIKDAGKDVAIQKLIGWRDSFEPAQAQGDDMFYANLVDSYRAAANEVESKAQREQLDDLLLSEAIYHKIKTTNEQTGAVDADTLIELQTLVTEDRKLSGPNEGFASRVREVKDGVVNVIKRRMMRGHTVNSDEAVHLMSFQFQQVDQILADFGYSNQQIDQMSAAEKSRLASIIPSGAFRGMDLSQKQVQGIINLVNESFTKEDGSQLTIKEATAATSRVYALTDQIQQSQENPAERQFLEDTLLGYYTEQGQINVQEIARASQEEFDAVRNAESIEQIMSDIETAGVEQAQFMARQQMARDLMGSAESDTIVRAEEQVSQKGILLSSSFIEGDVFGALASSALFAMAAGGELPSDERMGMLALDSAQGLAEAMNSKNNWVNALTPESSKARIAEATDNFRLARIKQAMEAQGAVQGALQGLSQELMFQGLSKVSSAAVNRIFPVRSGSKSSRALTGAATEVLSSVMAQSTARFLTGAKVKENQYTQEFLGRYLGDYVERAWQLVEQMQEAFLNSDTEVLDTDSNSAIAFDATGYVPDLQWDVETGLIVYGEDATELNAVFEGDSSQNVMATVESYNHG